MQAANPIACQTDESVVLDTRRLLGYDPRTIRFVYRENVLAHSKSALKRWRQSIERRDRNRSMKSRTRTLLTKALSAIGDDANAAEESVREAISALDRAAQKGVIHAN